MNKLILSEKYQSATKILMNVGSNLDFFSLCEYFVSKKSCGARRSISAVRVDKSLSKSYKRGRNLRKVKLANNLRSCLMYRCCPRQKEAYRACLRRACNAFASILRKTCRQPKTAGRDNPCLGSVRGRSQNCVRTRAFLTLASTGRG